MNAPHVLLFGLTGQYGWVMDGDRPISQRKQDRLGFSVVAEHLARALVDQPATDGFVVGIEGRWGSGKSSLINLTIEALRSSAGAPEIITFSPWLVGDRDELIRDLFGELAIAASKIDSIESGGEDETGHEPWRWRWKRKIWRDPLWKLKRKEQLKTQVSEKLRVFGMLAGGVGKIAKAAALFGLPWGDWLGSAIERSAETTKGFGLTRSISNRKSELVAALKLLSRRIIVFVDDLDRLEPREASEVLRLIRAVADFPNVIYVLSYDPTVVAQTLTKAVQVDDGTAFLEKIVQVSFRVPRPEAFDLRRWFQEEVGTLFATHSIADDAHARLVGRLARTIDIHGGKYLETPRDVARALNALRLHGVPVRDLIDIPDMVWLQLVRIGHPKLYLWVEEYLTEAAAVANGATVSEAMSVASATRLSALLDPEGVNIDRAIFELSDMLPGLVGEIPSRRGEPSRRRLFNNLRGDALNQLVASRRLGSPQHYRYYFAFSQPAGALRDEEVQGFIAAALAERNGAVQSFARFVIQVRPQGGTMADVLIDRLIAEVERIPEGAIPNVLASLADSLDAQAIASRDSDFRDSQAWTSAERLVSILLRRVSGDARAESLRALFSGRALGWLTKLLRSEIFAHGFFGDRAEPEDQRLLAVTEFPDVLASMLQRYRATPPEDLLRVPNFLSVLYAWQQGGQDEEVRSWVEQQTATDAGLLAFLSRIRGWAMGNEVYYPLNRRDIGHFLDYEAVVRRVNSIATAPDTSDEQRRLASELMVAVQQGTRHQ